MFIINIININIVTKQWRGNKRKFFWSLGWADLIDNSGKSSSSNRNFSYYVILCYIQKSKGPFFSTLQLSNNCTFLLYNFLLPSFLVHHWLQPFWPSTTLTNPALNWEQAQGSLKVWCVSKVELSISWNPTFSTAKFLWLCLYTLKI